MSLVVIVAATVCPVIISAHEQEEEFVRNSNSNSSNRETVHPTLRKEGIYDVNDNNNEDKSDENATRPTPNAMLHQNQDTRLEELSNDEQQTFRSDDKQAEEEMVEDESEEAAEEMDEIVTKEELLEDEGDEKNITRPASADSSSEDELIEQKAESRIQAEKGNASRKSSHGEETESDNDKNAEEAVEDGVDSSATSQPENLQNSETNERIGEEDQIRKGNESDDDNVKQEEQQRNQEEVLPQQQEEAILQQLRTQHKKREYYRLWGVYSKHKHVPDMELLYELFESRIKKELGITEAYLKESIFPLGFGSAEDDDDATSTGSTSEEEPSKTKEPDDDLSAKSINSDFVEGLDDIDKFFEGVDPPDELDVGASGSSIQEVLLRKGREILVKRIRLGVGFTRRLVSAAKTKLKKQFSSKDETVDLKQSVISVYELGRRVVSMIVQFIDELTGNTEDMDEEMNFDFHRDLRDPLKVSNLMKPPGAEEETKHDGQVS